MAAEETIVVQELAPVLDQEGFNPYYDNRLEYDTQVKTKVVGRWVKGVFYPVDFGHADKSE